ncbi:hypothetical protein L1987_17707 [Smallanthus sonchifolius]|uniref:Uncharacterized protein n=1 Tax=Smallanthus sonchifolius TaxID=185202 RepID=A0ACB9IXJ7_9ASTR|nr:hypothetical protein L1987_17707 [Smallanthus sonchifolius]
MLKNTSKTPPSDSHRILFSPNHLLFFPACSPLANQIEFLIESPSHFVDLTQTLNLNIRSHNQIRFWAELQHRSQGCLYNNKLRTVIGVGFEADLKKRSRIFERLTVFRVIGYHLPERRTK